MTYSEYDDRPELAKRQRRIFNIRRWLIVYIVAFSIFMATLAGVNAIFSFATRSALIDCTHAGGRCYNENAKHTADLIQQLNDVAQDRAAVTRERVKLMIYCQDLPGRQTLDEITTCVNSQLRKERNHDAPGK